MIEFLIKEREVEPTIRREIADRVDKAIVFLAAIGNKGANAFGSHLRTSVSPNFLDEFPVFAAADHVVSDVRLLELALADRVETNAVKNGIDNHFHLGRIEVGDSALIASVSVRGEYPGHFFHDSIVWINRVSAGTRVHHVGVKNDAGDERFTTGAYDACGIAQEPKSKADVPIAVIDPDCGVFGGEYAKQAALNGHADLTGRAAGGEAINVFVMVKIDMGSLAIKAGLPFDIAVQGYASYGMSLDEFLPSDDSPR